jgi:hypothetical protein
VVEVVGFQQIYPLITQTKDKKTKDEENKKITKRRVHEGCRALPSSLTEI